MDVLLGRFADCHIDHFDEDQLHRFELLLEQPDPELYAWYCRRQPVPGDRDDDILNLFMNFSVSP
jgi:antitoxin CptB